MKSLFLFQLLLVANIIVAQNRLDNLDWSKVSQKKVKAYIEDQVDHDLVNYADITSSCPNMSDVEGFNEHKKVYKLKNNIDSLWAAYTNANPSVTWKSRLVSFGLFFNRNTGETMYNGGKYNGADTGQVYYINLKLMAGLFNLATSFEVINIDHEKKMFEFSYVTGGKCKGRQRIILKEGANNKTYVTHQTFFSSGQKLRDRIYPFFHGKCIKKFHKNVNKFADHRLV